MKFRKTFAIERGFNRKKCMAFMAKALIPQPIHRTASARPAVDTTFTIGNINLTYLIVNGAPD